MKQALSSLIRFGIAAAILLYLVRSGTVSLAPLRGALESWPLLVVAFAVLVLDLVVTASRLCVLLRPRGFRLSLGASARLGFIGTFFNLCLPGSSGTDAVRIYYASAGNQGRLTELGTIIVFDRVIGLFGLAIFVPLIALPFAAYVRTERVLVSLVLISTLVAAAMVAGMVFSSTPFRWLRRPAEWVFRTLPFGRHAERILETVSAYKENPRTLFAAVGISLIAHTMTIAVLLLVAFAINPQQFAWKMALLLPLGFAANALPLTPGGLGVGEAAMDQLFHIAGLSGGAVIVLGWRVLTVLAGLIGLLLYLQGQRRQFVRQAASPARLEQESPAA